MAKEASIARIKVVLDNVEPPVVRRLEVPINVKLDRLHTILQAAMGWTNSHLYEFQNPRLRVWNTGPGLP